jgi:hypothetical protein
MLWLVLAIGFVAFQDLSRNRERSSAAGAF